MDCANETQHHEENGFESTEAVSEEMEGEGEFYSSEMECEDTTVHEENCVGSTCCAFDEKNLRICNNCCGDKEKIEKLRKRLRALNKEYDRLKNIILGKLLQLANLLVGYESTQSSRYPYVPSKKPNQEMMSRIALDIFPEFRQLEQTQRIVAELLGIELGDQ